EAGRSIEGRLELQRRDADVDRVETHLDTIEAAERIRALGEAVTNDEATDARDEDIGAVGDTGDLLLFPVGAAIEVQRLLGATGRPVEAVRLIDVDAEELRFADSAIDGPGQHDRVIPQNVRQRDGGAAKESAPEVVALIADRGPRDVVGSEPDAVGAVRELTRIRKREVCRVE